MEINWLTHPQYLNDEKRIVPEPEAVYALREGWKNIYKEYPSDNSLGILYAQTCLETGHFKVGFHNNNFGNIKASLEYINTSKENYFCFFACSEIEKGKEKWYYPPHVQTRFRAYKTIIKGAEDYILFLSQRTRYKRAWQELIKGDPKKYSHELKLGGYYTAVEAKYTETLVKLFNEFHKKKDELMSWQPIESKEEDKVDTIPVPADERPDRITTVPPASDQSKKEIILPPTPPLPKIDKIEEEETPDFKKHNKTGLGLVILAVIVGGITSMFQGCEDIITKIF